MKIPFPNSRSKNDEQNRHHGTNPVSKKHERASSVGPYSYSFTVKYRGSAAHKGGENTESASSSKEGCKKSHTKYSVVVFVFLARVLVRAHELLGRAFLLAGVLRAYEVQREAQ
jgi:hypothetical protein